MKKLCLALALVFILLALCSCSGYVNSYSATFLAVSSVGDEADIEFKTFKGTYNLKLTRDDADDRTLEYQASLAEGEINVYIGVGGEKDLLFTIKGGESAKAAVPLDNKYAGEKRVYIIIESVGKCADGDLEFEYD